MIAFIEGSIIQHAERSVIIRAGAMGWRVFIGPYTREKISKKQDAVSLFTYLYSRESSQELYGFVTFDEVRFFEALLSVSGVGPRNAQLIIDTLSPERAVGAIREEKSEVFTRISGIGKKTAQKIIIELQQKVDTLGLAGEADAETISEEDDAIEALCSLGYTRREARDALTHVPEGTEGLSQRVKEALKVLGASKK